MPTVVVGMCSAAAAGLPSAETFMGIPMAPNMPTISVGMAPGVTTTPLPDGINAHFSRP